MTTLPHPESCPRCGEEGKVRPKLLLIDEAWISGPDKEARLKYFASSLRTEDVEAEHLREAPLEQFVDGFYCDRCGLGFVSESVLKPTRRRYC